MGVALAQQVRGDKVRAVILEGAARRPIGSNAVDSIDTTCLQSDRIAYNLHFREEQGFCDDSAFEIG